MPKKNKLIVVDGNALIHRSFHALPPLTTKQGELINAVYGFTTVLLKMFRELKPTHVVVCFDRREKTFREKEYRAYKATRVKAPQDLYDQIPRVHELVEAFNIPVVEQAGYEADDCIGTITQRVRGVDKVIVTGDMDTLQLVDGETSVYTLKQGIGETVTLTPAAVKERFGITPAQLVDYKALRGDPSDNIPGVAGIGEKTATELLQQFGTLEKLYADLEKATPKATRLKEGVRQKLISGKKDAFLSKRLATIVRNVPIDFTLERAARKHYDRQRVVQLFRDFEFTSLLSKLPDNAATERLEQPLALPDSAPPPKKAGHDYRLVADEQAFGRFLDELKQAKAFTFDTETTGVDPLSSKLLGISFCWTPGTAYYVSIQDDWLERLRPVLEDASIQKHGHNLKFDYRVLVSAGLAPAGLAFDSMVASYLLNPGSRAHGLDQLVFEEFGYEMMPISALIGPRGKKQLPMESVPVEKLSWYSCEDADFTERLVQRFTPKLQEANLATLFDEIEMPLVPVLAHMEQHGVKLDAAFLKTMSTQLGRKLATLQAAIFKLAGREFNVASPIQLKQVLFDDLGLATHGIGRTKTGLSTAADELEKLRDRHPIIPKILEFRELSKLKSTYLDALPALVSPVDDRLHASFNQTVAATGRLSSSDPNLQNIPIRTELGAQIRKSFIAERGNRILAADYSQFELRIAASVANVTTMIESFRKGEDIHARTAAEMHGIPLDQVTKAIRATAKEVNFGVLYGMGASGLAQRQGITRDRAQAFIDQYYAVYHELRDWLDETIAMARARGYAETLFGRRRYLPELNANNPMLRSAAERAAINMPIQGTQADLMKMAMIKVDALLPKLSAGAKMVLQVHDELVFEVPDKDVPKVAKAVKETLETIYKLKVPFEVNIEMGRSWGETKKLGEET